ncbi:hypothetical protein D3C81_1969000 [compost metagenome]
MAGFVAALRLAQGQQALQALHPLVEHCLERRIGRGVALLDQVVQRQALVGEALGLQHHRQLA